MEKSRALGFKKIFIDLVAKIYNINPEGKGKKRKRALQDIINAIEKI